MQIINKSFEEIGEEFVNHQSSPDQHVGHLIPHYLMFDVNCCISDAGTKTIKKHDIDHQAKSDIIRSHKPSLSL